MVGISIMYPLLPSWHSLKSFHHSCRSLECKLRPYIEAHLPLRPLNITAVSLNPIFYIYTTLPSFRSLFLLSAGLVQLPINAPALDVSNNYAANAEAAFNTLQRNYNTTSGIYDTTGWWNSANCLTVVGDLAAIDSSVKLEVLGVYANSISAAPSIPIQMTKIIRRPSMLMETVWGSEFPTLELTGFLNDFYDDEGWWALAWIQAYDLTLNPLYLRTAVDVFEDMRQGESTPCGGIWWDKAHSYVNAIANELYLSVAAHLANRVLLRRRYYQAIAVKQWNWFQQSGMINAENTINDGLTAECKTNAGTVWSYNQGVILGALVELARATTTGNDEYLLDTASSIATSAISALSDSNLVLHDVCEPACGADGSQFKGIFMRGLAKLQNARGDEAYAEFIRANAKSIWAKNRNQGNELGIVWSGPFEMKNAGTQSSALDALVAAAAFEGSLKK